MKTTIHLLALISILLVCKSTAQVAQPQVVPKNSAKQGGGGQTLDPIGTWKYSDKVQLEVRPDGTFLSNSKPAGKWVQRDKKSEYFLVLNDRSEYIMTVDKYKRTLTTESRARGEKKTMSRIDNGPTINPDAPDQRTSWKMECDDLVIEIQEKEARVEAKKAAAADLWQKHHAARAAGRPNSWNIEAKEEENWVRYLEKEIPQLRVRLVDLKSKAGLK